MKFYQSSCINKKNKVKIFDVMFKLLPIVTILIFLLSSNCGCSMIKEKFFNKNKLAPAEIQDTDKDSQKDRGRGQKLKDPIPVSPPHS